MDRFIANSLPETEFSPFQIKCAHALMRLPNKMGSASSVASLIGKDAHHLAVTSAMGALIRKDNTRPCEKSKWVVRLPPKDQYCAAWYALTDEFINLLGYELVDGKWEINKKQELANNK